MLTDKITRNTYILSRYRETDCTLNIPKTVFFCKKIHLKGTNVDFRTTPIAHPCADKYAKRAYISIIKQLCRGLFWVCDSNDYRIMPHT